MNMLKIKPTTIIPIKNRSGFKPSPIYSRDKIGYRFGEQIKKYKPIMFSEKLTDEVYRLQVKVDSGLIGVKEEDLSSIVGPNELRRIVSENNNNRKFWVPGERPADKKDIPDSNGLENVLSREFGASIHIHTVNSDGAMSVQEILDQAVVYADEYAKSHDTRFIVGITDHNTIHGCKEAVKILAKNPKKYKNLGVVLGTEISTKENSIGQYELKKPEKLHILGLCINPFDYQTNKFFSDLNRGKTCPMNPKPIGVKDAINGLKTQEHNWISLAHPAFPYMSHRVQNKSDYLDATEEMIRFFKDTAKDKALYTEHCYASYAKELATDKNLHNTIKNTADAVGLYKAGGIDTHGNSIFYGGHVIQTKHNK